MFEIKYALIDLGLLRQRDVGFSMKLVWIILNCLLSRASFFGKKWFPLEALHGAHLRASFFSPLCQLRSALLPSISRDQASLWVLLWLFLDTASMFYIPRNLTLQVNIASHTPYLSLSLFVIALSLSGICPPASSVLDSTGPITLPCLNQSSSQNSPLG